jgi:ABC-type nitrate/sulfonate/bicarbonate transport system substrate-binding protein
VSRARLPALALTAAAALLAGCGHGARARTSSPQPAVEVAYPFPYDAGDVADRLAFAGVRRKGIAVRVRELGGVANVVVALVRGEVQLASMPYSTAIRAVDEGAHVRVVLGRNMTSDFVLVARPGIDSVAALRGRRVAFDAQGLDGDTLVRVALERAGLPSADVKLSQLADSAARAAALAAGRVDAAVLDQADYERLRGLGVVVLARLSAFEPRSAASVWVVSQRWANEHPVLVGRIVRGLLDGYAYVYTAAGRRAWIAAARRAVFRSDPTLAPGIYAFYRAVRFWPLRDRPVTRAEHRRAVRFWLDAHELARYVPFARVWDPSWWRGAARAPASTA